MLYKAKTLAAAGFMALLPLSAQAACLDPASTPDKDVQRNAALLPAGQFCITEESFSEHGVTWRVFLIENTKYPNGPVYFLPHDHENEAFDTAVYGMRKYGGRAVAIETGETRHHHGQDPNRNFGDTAASTATCRDMIHKGAPVFTRYHLDQRGGPKFILTLHNNANGYNGDGKGGSGGISVKRASSVLKGLPAASGMDEDDVILIAGKGSYEDNAKARRTAEHLVSRGVNVIYERVTEAGNDCSFSNYAVLHGLEDYYNIEAEHGHIRTQKVMLDVLLAYKNVRVRDKSVE
jgi:hypothetical protein